MRRLIGLTLVVTSIAVACGLPQSSNFQAIPPDDVQFGLDQATTTSTSTIPPTTVDATSTTLLETTSTISLEEVKLYFVAGSQLLTPVSVQLASPATPPQVLASLLNGPPSGDVGTGLRSTIPPDSAITVTIDRGTAIIDLPADIFDSMPTRDQRLVFAQLVLTIGALGGVGPVQFTKDGEPAQVLKGDGTTTTAGEAVVPLDYAQLLSGAPPETTTTTTTTTTTPPPVEAVDPGTTSATGGG